MNTVDLHVHTTASDGTASPAEAVELAARLGLRTVAVTDHDTVAGHAEALAAGKACGVEVIPGIEISTVYLYSPLDAPEEQRRCSVHILGYYMDDHSPELTAFLSGIVENRDRRNRRICALMAADGLPADYEALQARFGSVIGRPHFAQLLVEQGLAESVNDAFARYLSSGRPYYLPRDFIDITEAIRTLRAARAVPVLAHPYQYKLAEPDLRALIERCISAGLLGMECRYSLYDARQSARLEALAAEYGLLMTGGSDYHGSRKPHIRLGSGTGSLEVPSAFPERLRQAADRLKQA